MWRNIRQQARKWQEVLITTSCITGLTLFGSLNGWFQTLELKGFDRFTNLRPSESVDPRIAIVTIDEQDLSNYGFPISDQILAQTLEIIKQQQPRVIAVDLYRNLPQKPGTEQLVKTFQTTDNLIGVEKVVDESVPPPHTLPSEQVAFSDLVIDPDSKVRRTLLSLQKEDGTLMLSLGTLAALNYLSHENITLERLTPKQSNEYRLGKARIKPLRANDGGYVGIDTGGYQILLNYRGVEYKFRSYSLTDVLEGNTPADWGNNRIIFIGSISESINDRFLTPFSSSPSKFPLSTPGVVIHANISSQLLSAAQDGRYLIKVFDDYIEWIWLLNWCLIGSILSWQFIERNIIHNHVLFWSSWFISCILLPSIALLGLSYVLFVQGWWIPVVVPWIGLSLSALTIPNYKNYITSQSASLDSLTKVPNRRYFDIYFPKLWNEFLRSEKPISVILCDVDYFKPYNDYYGHQAGDKCLYQVAQAISQTIRSSDIVARYGGEEFVVILPDTSQEVALKIGDRICEQVRNLAIAHQKSLVKELKIVSISGGLATAYAHHNYDADDLIANADRRLYQAKALGRNQIICDDRLDVTDA